MNITDNILEELIKLGLSAEEIQKTYERYMWSISKTEKYEKALIEIDTHIRSTKEPIPCIVETLLKTLPQYDNSIVGDYEVNPSIFEPEILKIIKYSIEDEDD